MAGRPELDEAEVLAGLSLEASHRELNRVTLDAVHGTRVSHQVVRTVRVHIADHPLLTDVAESLSLHDYGHHALEQTQFDLALLVGSQHVLTVDVFKPLVYDLHFQGHVCPYLTILSIDLDVILVLLFLHKQLAHVQGVLLGGNLEILLHSELLGSLLSQVLNLALKCD